MNLSSTFHTVSLTPDTEEMSARQAGARGQSIEEYLTALVADALAQRAAEELPEAGSDPLAFWEQEMALRHPDPSPKEHSHRVRYFLQERTAAPILSNLPSPTAVRALRLFLRRN